MSDIKDLNRTLKQTKALTKYGMTAICFLMTTHCGFLYFDKDLFVVHLLFVAFVLSIALQLSRIYHLCIVHRLSIIYSMSVIMCVVLRRHDMFIRLGIDLHTARGAMFFIGVIMVFLNLGKWLKSV